VTRSFGRFDGWERADELAAYPAPTNEDSALAQLSILTHLPKGDALTEI